MKTTDHPTHHIATDGVFEPISNADTGRFLRRLEDWRNDIEIEERLPVPVAVNVEVEIDRLDEMVDKRWLNRILSTGPHDLAALDACELRVLALQARNFEDRLRERGNLFSAELTRRQRAKLARALPDAPAFLKVSAEAL